jgi:hypothetical protein
MQRFLVIGCGGSGGATLAYMMDQLKSVLAAAGYRGKTLPSGWQFLHVDVPVTEERGPQGLPNVEQAGGSYVSLGVVGQNYRNFEEGLWRTTSDPAQVLRLIGSWAPKQPEKVNVALYDGAGQYRAVGRAVTLRSHRQLTQALNRVWRTNLRGANVTAEMSEVAKLVPGDPTWFDGEPPMILVVLSMAGGAGASLALDLCRMLNRSLRTQSRQVAVFMYTPDVFSDLSSTNQLGVLPNSLALLGEVVASQNGSAAEHDQALLRALQAVEESHEVVPMGAVFPVTPRVGDSTTGLLLGDGSREGVFRAFGRGLASLMVSGEVALSAFRKYDLTNTETLAIAGNYFGWGEGSNSDVPWGSFGYASLSMGRDRYAHYAAQRLARGAVDHLLNGHKTDDPKADEAEQVRAHILPQINNFLTRAGLPAPTAKGAPDADLWQTVAQWFRNKVLTDQTIRSQVAERVAREVTPLIPYSNPAQRLHAWVTTVKARLALPDRGDGQAPAGVAERIADDVAKRVVYAWRLRLLDDLAAAAEEQIALVSLTVAGGLLTEAQRHLQAIVIPTLEGLANGHVPIAQNRGLQAFLDNLAKVADAEVRTLARSLDQDLSEAILKAMVQSAVTRGQAYAATVLRHLAAKVIPALRDEVDRKGDLLSKETQKAYDATGLADLRTDHYSLWPSRQDKTPHKRFSQADNEVLLTEAADFPARFEADVRAGLPGSPTVAKAEDDAVAHVTKGDWEVLTGEPPRGLITSGRPAERWAWVPEGFDQDPDTGAPVVTTTPRFEITVNPADLLARGHAFVARAGFPFAQFIAESLADYAAQGPEHENRIVDKFQDTLRRAAPLVHANPEAVATIHPSEPRPTFRYKFSTIPFNESLAARLAAFLDNPNSPIDHSSADNFRDATKPGQPVLTISVFGSYPKYAPVVFESVLQPIANKWQTTTPDGRMGFWQWRRTRPLVAALPLNAAERRAMVCGWLIGQITGDLRIHPDDWNEPAEIWDAQAKRWRHFPALLTPRDTRGFTNNDILPAVLESVLLAVAQATEAPVFDSLTPYRLLRGLYDDNPLGPTEGEIPLAQLAGIRNLATWLGQGRGRSGGSSAIPELLAPTTVADRVRAARLWLKGQRDRIGEHLLLKDEARGIRGGGLLTQVATRTDAAGIPLEADIAEDLWEALPTVNDLIIKAEKDATAAPLKTWEDPFGDLGERG